MNSLAPKLVFFVISTNSDNFLKQQIYINNPIVRCFERLAQDEKMGMALASSKHFSNFFRSLENLVESVDE